MDCCRLFNCFAFTTGFLEHFLRFIIIPIESFFSFFVLFLALQFNICVLCSYDDDENVKNSFFYVYFLVRKNTLFQT